MKLRIVTILKFLPWGEMLIVGAIVLLSAYYFNGSESLIAADGKGYYEYLPSAFIRHDLNRHSIDTTENAVLFDELKQMGFYLPAGSGLANKYFCGTAVLMSPFFLTGTMIADAGDNGYSPLFQNLMFISALFYLFGALIFFRGLLKLYRISPAVIFACQVLMVFATSTLHYTYNESSFSHVYSLFAVSGFLYFVKAWHVSPRMWRLVMIGLLFGLICIIRPVNGLILLFVPFLFDSGVEFVSVLKQIFSVRWKLIFPIAAFLIVVSVQMITWYLQCGKFFIYSYGDEGFNFLSPEYFRFLFSWERGVFIYAPVLLLVVPALFFMAIKSEFYRVTVWLLFFGVTVYILSSWHVWSYGCSYGQRPMIEYYPVFFLPIALFLHRSHGLLRWPLIAAGGFFVYLAVIQTYQYRNFILRWESMTKEGYWSIFLRTEDHYRGYLYKTLYNDPGFRKMEEYNRDSLRCDVFYSDTVLVFKEPGETFAKMQLIKVTLTDYFDTRDPAVIEVSVRDSASGNLNYAFGASKMHFAGFDTDKETAGRFDYLIPAFNSASPQIVVLKVYTNAYPARLREISMSRWE